MATPHVKKKKVLFITPYARGTAGSQRFRFEQYFDELAAHGIQYRQVPFVDRATYRIMYRPGHWPGKVWGVLKGILRRTYALLLVPFYDVVFVHREATPIGLPVFEFMISKVLRKPYIYDFDDAIWKLDISDTNKALGGLRYSPQKIPRTMRMANKVLAGNDYLAGYARAYNNRVQVFPTIVDTDYHRRKETGRAPDKVCIGWTGTHTTLRHFEIILDELTEVYAKYRDRIYFKLIVNADAAYEALDLVSTRWNLQHEIEELSEFDIGLMPLPDDEWSNGKCGFKAIQYLALGIPALVSPVGINTKIVEDGVSGYVCRTGGDWIERLEELINDAELRRSMGMRGREKIVREYSREANRQVFIAALE